MKSSDVYYYSCSDEVALQMLASKLALMATPPILITLQGELGVGKTTFARAWLRQLGVTGRINSPTFTLIEPYETEQGMYYHFDLYRLKEADELELLGFRDYLLASCLIEWPEQVQSYLPEPDIHVHIEFFDSARRVTLRSSRTKGKGMLRDLIECQH